MEALGGLYLVFALVVLFIAVLWILMPFAIFGTKGILSDLVSEMRENNRLLREIRDQKAKPMERLSSAP